jgi:hypothetical protein
MTQIPPQPISRRRWQPQESLQSRVPRRFCASTLSLLGHQETGCCGESAHCLHCNLDPRIGVAAGHARGSIGVRCTTAAASQPRGVGASAAQSQRGLSAPPQWAARRCERFFSRPSAKAHPCRGVHREVRRKTAAAANSPVGSSPLQRCWRLGSVPRLRPRQADGSGCSVNPRAMGAAIGQLQAAGQRGPSLTRTLLIPLAAAATTVSLDILATLPPTASAPCLKSC